MPSAAELLRNKEFYKLPPAEQLNQLSSDPEFKELTPDEQKQLVVMAGDHFLGNKFTPPIDNRFNPIPSGGDPPAQSKSFRDHLTDFGSTIGHGVKSTIELAGALTNPQKMVQIGKDMVIGQVDQFKQGTDQWGKGERLSGAGHMLAGALPVVGPIAAQMGEDLGSGDYGKFAGNAALLVAPKMLSKVPIPNPQTLRLGSRAKGAIQGTKESLSGGAEYKTKGTPTEHIGMYGMGTMLGLAGEAMGGHGAAALGSGAGMLAGKFGPRIVKGAVEGWKRGGVSKIEKALQPIEKLESGAPTNLSPSDKYLYQTRKTMPPIPETIEPIGKIESSIPSYGEVEPTVSRVVPKPSEQTAKHRRAIEAMRSKQNSPEKKLPVYSDAELPRIEPISESVVAAPVEANQLKVEPFNKPKPTMEEGMNASAQLAEIFDPTGETRAQTVALRDPNYVKNMRATEAMPIRVGHYVDKIVKGKPALVAEEIDLMSADVLKGIADEYQVKPDVPLEELRKALKIRLTK